MPPVVASNILQELPPGPNLKVFVAAEYILDTQLTDMVKQSVIRDSLRAVLPQLQGVISRAMSRSYAASGLGVISGALRRHAEDNFDISFTLHGRMVTVTAVWRQPSIRYFFIHLFGGTIVPKKAGGTLRFKIGERVIFAKRVVIPARPYIRLDTLANVDMFRVLTDALQGILVGLTGIPERERRVTTREKQLKAREEALKVREAAVAVREVAAPSGRITPFRVRKALRPPGPLSAAEARRLGEILARAGVSAETIVFLRTRKREELLRTVRGLALFLRTG